MKISLLGTGLMGQALSEHLLQQPLTLTLFNRTPEKIQHLAEKGAHIADSASAAVSASEITLLMLSDAAAIHAVLDTLAADAVRNRLIIQMGTIAPAQSRAIAERIQTGQGHYLECPVLGSLPEARSGSLILMAAGHREDYDTALPVLQLIGKHIEYFGEVGQGATIKLAMNQLIAGLTATFSLSLALVEKEGIEIEQFMTIVRNSALYAPTFDKKLDRMRQRDFANPNFPTRHLAKDTRLFLDVAERLGLETCALEGVEKLLSKTLALGLADTDYSAIHAAVTSNSGKC